MSVTNQPPVTFAQTTSAASSTTYVVTTTLSVPQSAQILVITGSSGADTATGVTDSQGNFYAVVASTVSNENIQAFVAVALKPLTGGTDTVTVTYTTATTQQKNIICVYVNQAIVQDIDIANGGNSGTASLTGGTPAWYNEMCIAAIQGANGTTPFTAPVTGNGVTYTQFATEAPAGQQTTTLYYSYVQTPAAQTLSSTLGASGQWGMILVTFSVMPATEISVPQFPAGFGPQQIDVANEWVTAAAFFQQRVMFRAIQTHGVTSLPSSQAQTIITYDTILEDPYGGWNDSTFHWVCPNGISGWFQVTVVVWVVGPGALNVTLNAYVDTPFYAGNYLQNIPLVNINIPNANSGAEGTYYVYLAPGSAVGGGGSIFNSASNVNTSTTAGQQSSIEIVWIST